MADTYDVIVGNKSARYENPREAGAAYFMADRDQRASVVHMKDGQSKRVMAESALEGKYENGTNRFVKSLPHSHAVDVDFRSGYFEALEKSLGERLKAVDWEAAKTAFANQAPKMDGRIYDDLEQLAKVDLTKAAGAWEANAPKETQRPAVIDRDWQRQNVEARKIDAMLNEALRGPQHSMMQIDDKVVMSIRFQRGSRDDGVAFDVSYHIGNRSVMKLKGLDAEALADAVGERNAKAIIEHPEPKGQLKGNALQNEYGISPAENARRIAMKELRKIGELDQTRSDLGRTSTTVPQLPRAVGSDQERAANASEPNVVEHVRELDIKEAVERARLIRQHEHEKLGREQGRLSTEAEGKRINVENLSEKARDQDAANDLADRTGSVTDRQSQLLTEREKNRQVELMEQVHSQFRVAGPKYHFKDQPDKLAFKDKGDRMVSGSNDDRVARAMATMAEAKGWKTIKVSGHPEFARAVWMEASLRGLEVRGYKPTEQDTEQLETRRDRAMRNTVEREPQRARGSAGPEASPRRTHGRQVGDRGKDRAGTPEGRDKLPAGPLRAVSGRLVEHGEARYKHDPKQQLSYYVKLATDKGERTLWGVDLKRALHDGKAEKGDDVNLVFKGEHPVTVHTPKRDGKGRVVGVQEIPANRNSWEVQKSDRHKVAEAVAAALIDATVQHPGQRDALKAAVGARLAERDQGGKVPAVQVYDKSAPSRTRERAGPVVERNAERTRSR